MVRGLAANWKQPVGFVFIQMLAVELL